MYYPFYPETNIDTEKHIVMGVFEHIEQLTAVIARLEEIGYGEDKISVVATDEGRARHFAIEHHNKAAEGAASGGIGGGLAGAILAGLMSAGVVASGGLQLAIAGPILSILAGFGAGSAAGGLIGALIGAGIPEHDITYFKKRLHAGHVLVAVETDGPHEADEVYQIFRAENALNTDERWESGVSNQIAG